MNGGGGSNWIPTERTHPVYFVQVFGAQPLLIGALTYLWFTVLIPMYGLAGAIFTVVATAVVVLLLDTWTWRMFRPNAIRVSPEGIEIRRGAGKVLMMPKEGLELRPRTPEGFGFAKSPGLMGYVLSPNQFAAAKTYFPVEGPGAVPTGKPLP